MSCLWVGTLTDPNSMHGSVARRFTGTCPDGFTQRDAEDMHECSDGVCDESDCCQNGCHAFPWDGCPEGQQRKSDTDQSGCSSLPDADGDGIGDDCTADTCCYTPCGSWDGTCDVGEKSGAWHIGCGTCCCPVPSQDGEEESEDRSWPSRFSCALRFPCRVSRPLRLLLLDCNSPISNHGMWYVLALR